MPSRSFLLGVFLVAGCHVRPESLLPAGASRHAPEESEFLCRAPATFVVVGDSTSFAWPALLQDLLDAHADQSGLYRVLNGAVDSASAGSGASALEAMARAALAQPGAAEGPRVALCMVSLRGIGDERGPVKSENDMVGAEMGADALEALALELYDGGFERVVFASPLFAPASGPELGLERVAIERLLSRGHAFVASGPDVFAASRRYFPDAFADESRPNEFGTKLVAEEWYRWLAGPQADEDVIERLYSEDYDVDALEALQSAPRAPRP